MRILDIQIDQNYKEKSLMNKNQSGTSPRQNLHKGSQKPKAPPPQSVMGKKQMMVQSPESDQRIAIAASIMQSGPPNQHRNHNLTQISKHEVNRQTITDEAHTGSSKTDDDFTASPPQMVQQMRAQPIETKAWKDDSSPKMMFVSEQVIKDGSKQQEFLSGSKISNQNQELRAQKAQAPASKQTKSSLLQTSIQIRTGVTNNQANFNNNNYASMPNMFQVQPMNNQKVRKSSPQLHMSTIVKSKSQKKKVRKESIHDNIPVAVLPLQQARAYQHQKSKKVPAAQLHHKKARSLLRDSQQRSPEKIAAAVMKNKNGGGLIQPTADLEEEKEVPSEHPVNTRKITPTRNGCNVTACKGFSFENMALQTNNGSISLAATKERNSGDQMEQNDISGEEELIESGFLVIEEKAAEVSLLYDIEEMNLNQNNLGQRNQQQQQQQPIKIRQEEKKQQWGFPPAAAQMSNLIGKKQGDEVSFFSADNSFNQSFQNNNQQQVAQIALKNGQMMINEEQVSNGGNNTSIDENKAAMDMSQFQQTSQMMPCAAPSITHQAPVMVSASHQQQTSGQRRNDELSSAQRRSRQINRSELGMLHQTMASCDLQASFRSNNTRNPQETTSRTKTMTQQQQQRLACFPLSSFNQQDLHQPLVTEARLFESSEYQAISKTRLWREIFYLREFLQHKDDQAEQVELVVADLEDQLKAERQSNLAFEKEIEKLNSKLNSMQQEQQQKPNSFEEEKQQPPILQNELRSRSMIQCMPKSSSHNSDTASLESTSMPQYQQVQQSTNKNRHPVTKVDSSANQIKLDCVPNSNFRVDPIAMPSQSPPQNQDNITTDAQQQLAAPQNIDQQQQQQPIVNCFNPPTQASQLRVRQPQSQQQDQQAMINGCDAGGDVGYGVTTAMMAMQEEEQIGDTAHALPPQGLQRVHATTRAQSNNSMAAFRPSMQQQVRRGGEVSFFANTNHHHNNTSSVASLLNRVGEENNQQFTSNDESVLINKVNEMQTKTASFGYQQPPQQNKINSSSDRFQMNRHQRDVQSPMIAIRSQQMQVAAEESKIGVGLTTVEQEQFLEYDEIDEQVTSGVRLIAGPRSGPLRAPQNGSLQQSQAAQIQLTTLSQHNQIEIPASMLTQALSAQTQPSMYQNTQLQQQRPCDQPPPRNIQGDIQSHVDAEEISTLEGVGSGLVPQQRIPLPNQLQQPMPRQPSHDSLLDPDLTYTAAAAQHHQLRQSTGRPMLRSNPGARLHQQLNFYAPLVADDAGMDEFDVADERLHLFGESVNPDIMTYEQLIALQERIGFVPKGMTVQEMDKYPTMKRNEVKCFIRHGTAKVHRVVKTRQGDDARDPHQLYKTFYQSVHLHDGARLAMDIEEEEKKSHQESVGDKSLRPQSSSFESSSGHDPNKYAVKESSSFKSGSGTVQQIQLEENYLSMQNSQTSAFVVSETQLLRQRNNQQQITISQNQNMLIQGLSSPQEEGREDLEEAAPEEHHPKEEHLQQIGVSVPMPGHHISSHSAAQNAQRSQNNCQVTFQQSTRRSAQQSMRPNVANVTTEDEDNNCSQEASQEDVFDEGEDVLNRRLPIVVNINGSIPNQRPTRAAQNDNHNHNHQSQAVYANQITIQGNLGTALQRVASVEVSIIDEESGHQGNIYEEHKANEFGVQTPKYAQTKTSQKQDQAQRTHGENHMEDEQSVLRQADQPTIVKHHGQSRQLKMLQRQQINNLGLMQIQKQASSTRSIAMQSSQSKLSSSGISTTLGQEVCIVCQEIFQAEESVKVLPCSHYFHVDCVNQWLLVEKKCPMCMIPLS